MIAGPCGPVIQWSRTASHDPWPTACAPLLLHAFRHQHADARFSGLIAIAASRRVIWRSNPMNTTSPPPAAPSIRLLRINRFRGIESLTWRPDHGLNIILGGGDVCKTTILEAIAMLLSPHN